MTPRPRTHHLMYVNLAPFTCRTLSTQMPDPPVAALPQMVLWRVVDLGNQNLSFLLRPVNFVMQLR